MEIGNMADKLIYVSHIDDSSQQPCLYFWGRAHDENLYYLMEQFFERIRSYLEKSIQPLTEDVLKGNRICCVLIGLKWYRAKVLSPKFVHNGTLEVFCIDNGKTHFVPLTALRTLEVVIPGSQVEDIKNWRPLATKFILADVSAPFALGSSSRQWSTAAVTFFNKHVANQTWKSALLGVYGGHQGVRLFDSNNQLLAQYLVERGLGVAAHTYQDAVAMSQKMKEKVAKPTLPEIHPNTFAESPPTPKDTPETASVPSRRYLTSMLSEEERHHVVITHMANGPYKFQIQLTREAEAHQNLRKALDSLTPHPFPGTPKSGDPCIAVCPSDKRFHRCLITSVDDCRSNCFVYFVDIGTEYQLSLPFICDITNELLALPTLVHQVSLNGVEDVAELSGLNDIFSSLVKSAGYLLARFVNQHQVVLFDHTGRSFLDVLGSIKSNLLATILGVIPKSPSIVSTPKTITEQVPKKKVLTLDDSLRDISADPDFSPTETSDVLDLFQDFDWSADRENSSLRNHNLDRILLMDVNFTPGQLMSSIAVASHVVSDKEVWIQLDPAAVDLLVEEIALTDVLQLTQLKPEIGIYCLCFYRQDARWYRAVVQSLTSVNCASVKFIDYGISSIVDVDDLRVLPPNLSLRPGLALRCALDGAEMRCETSTKDCRSEITEIGRLTVVFVRQTVSHFFVRLFDDSGVDLNEKMGLSERNLLDLDDKKVSTASILMNSLVTNTTEIDLDSIMSCVTINSPH